MQMVEPPLIMTVEQTIDALIEGKSIARFGDGELWTMEGKFEFQVPSSELTQRMAAVLVSDEPGLLIGIPGFVYELSPQLADGMRDHCLRSAPRLRPVLNKYLQPGKTYAATEVSLAHSVFRESFDRGDYFDRCRQIWDGAHVVLIHGEGIFDGLTHDIFDNAGSVDHVLAPKMNAFDQYEDILSRSLQAPKDSLMITILGPTATLLAYDLHRAGYRALDLGHIAKSYDWWLRGRTTYEETANIEFFAAD